MCKLTLTQCPISSLLPVIVTVTVHHHGVHMVGTSSLRYFRTRGMHDKYALRRGAVFGLSHNLAQLSLLRPARRHPGARGLHWVGASTRPGNGVPLVLIGAELAAAEALQDLGVAEAGSLA